MVKNKQFAITLNPYDKRVLEIAAIKNHRSISNFLVSSGLKEARQILKQNSPEVSAN